MLSFATGLAQVACAVLLFSTASAQTVEKVDGSSREAFRHSVDALIASASEAQRSVMRESIELMVEFLPKSDDAFRRFDGLTLEQFVGVSKKVIAVADVDGDGEVDVVERAKMRKTLLDAQKNANEAAVRAALKMIAAAQGQMQCAGVIDTDADGTGEYAYFGEMTALSTVRDENGASELRISPPVLPASLTVEGRRVTRYGYHFQIWLPGRDGQPVPEAERGGVDAASMPCADEAELSFVCYAWPVKRGVTGDRVFMIDAAGDVLVTDNDVQKYGGTKRTPGPLAALPKGSKGLDARFAPKRQATDRGSWRVENFARPAR